MSAPRNLKFLQHNFRFSPTAFDVSIEYFYRENFDVIFACDLPSTIARGKRIPGYNSILPNVKPDETNVGLLVKEDIFISGIYSPSGRVVGGMIQLGTLSLAVICVYIRHSTGEGLPELFDLVQLLEDKGISCLVSGDFNARSPIWGPLSTPTNANGRKVLDWIDKTGITLINAFPSLPTFISSSNGHESWIDLSFISDKSCHLIDFWRVIPREDGLSDHNFVIFELINTENPRLVDPNPNWRAADWTRIADVVESEFEANGWLSFDWNQIKDVTLFDQHVRKFETDLLTIAKQFAPTRRRSSYRKHWWSQDLSVKHKQLKKMRRRAHKLKSKYGTCQQELLNEIKTLKKTFADEVQRAKNRSWNEFLLSTAPKDLWRNFKRINCRRKQVDLSFLWDETGNLLDHEDLIVRALARKFFPCPPPEKPLLPESGGLDDEQEGEESSSSKSINFPEVTHNEMARAVFGNKMFGACGPDSLPNKILRVCFPFLASSLIGIANACLRLSWHCKLWKRASIVIVPKNPWHNNNVKNLRPISLLCAISKCVEKIVAARIMYSLESRSQLSHSQFGFRRTFSCEEALLNFTGDVERNLECKRAVVCASLDISAAFDSIDHAILIDRASCMGIDKYLINWLKNFLSDRWGVIQTNGVSTPFQIYGGAPQGSPLSPALFLIYINGALGTLQSLRTGRFNGSGAQTDLLQCNTTVPASASIQAFADDLLIWCTHNDASLAGETLQESLNLVHDWCVRSKLTLNASKCVFVQFLKPRTSPSRFRMYLNGQILSESTFLKYLGVHIDQKLKWNVHIDAVMRKASKRINELRKISNIRNGFTPQFISNIFRATVESMIYYASCVWGKVTCFPAMQRPLERCIRHGGLMISGCLKTTSYPAVYLMSGRRPPCFEIRKSLILMGCRLAQHGKSRYLAAGDPRRAKTSFARLLALERKEIIKDTGKDVIALTKVLHPRNLPPWDSHKMIVIGDCQLHPCYEDLKLYCYSARCQGLTVCAWTVCYKYIQREGYLRFSLGEAQHAIEIDVLIKSLNEAILTLKNEMHGELPQKVFLLMPHRKTATELMKQHDLTAATMQAQDLIAELHDKGVVCVWRQPSETLNLSPLMRAKALARSVLNDYTIEAGNRTTWMGHFPLKKLLKSWLDSKTDSYIRTCFDTGRAALLLPLSFQRDHFPSHGLNRKEGSMISQFLSNHFASGTYFSRFELNNDKVLCEHDQDSRDHLLFVCDRFESVRSLLCDALEIPISMLNWEIALSNMSILADFLSGVMYKWLGQSLNCLLGNI